MIIAAENRSNLFKTELDIRSVLPTWSVAADMEAEGFCKLSEGRAELSQTARYSFRADRMRNVKLISTG